jgi:hypothetical protein
MTTMLYRHPGQHDIHGGKFDYIITDDIDAALADGWYLTTTEAKAASAAQAADNSPPTREEMEDKAKELSLKFSDKTTDKKLLQMIVEALENVDKATDHPTGV